jgi:hypothetical protein
MSDEEPTGDDAATERQLFGEQLRTQAAFVACDLGVARVSLAGGRIGHAGLVERCTATSVAAGAERVVAGSVRGVLVDEGDGFDRRGEPFEVAAVGLTGEGRALAAGDDGRVVAWESDHGWESVGRVADPQRFDGAVLAAGDGVYRVTDELTRLGLSAAHDVASAGLFAATENGLYRQTDDGWQREHDRPAATVAAAGGRAHGIDDRSVRERVDGVWESVDTPTLPVDLAYIGVPCGITADGTVLVSEREESDGYGNWRSHPLGLRGVVEFDAR